MTTTVTKDNGREVSDDLLAAFDSITGQGETLPLEEIKKRYKGSAHFYRYNQHQIYVDIIDLPVTVDMVLGKKSSAVEKILEGLRELHGDELEFTFAGRGDEAVLNVRKWRDEPALRKLWREFAEEEYKTNTTPGSPS